MTSNADFARHWEGCTVCLGYLAHCMVEPVRGSPSEEYLTQVKKENETARLAYFDANRDHLTEQGVSR